MSEIYVGKIKNLGKLGEAVMRCKNAWLSKELIQGISIAQTVIKLKERYDFWIESATNLLAGIILYLNQRHGDFYYLDLEKVREFVQQAKEKDPNLSELLKKDHPAYQMFSVLALSAKETRQGTISTILRILDEQQEQYEKLEKQREYLGFQY
ncbi:MULTISPECIES: hypothetical protein [Bacillus]|uniref:hypothetical protein n=1 Tax=Bacillus TaxID=1386 RepID=UPI0001A07341|nr:MULTISPECIES: hypothetical protein [Bacillus]EEL19525.1 hypothetical protein bcere0017_57080 [Bacillus cereus Rock1-3]KNH30785.1 hypothetical protein ACS75_29270 [Bacillus thuringiensis]KXY15748.1 hypothetical protein AT259_24020 [Bacillus cereus]MDH8708517.1 hypothetical protein [Stenotrophomonas sp. 1198]EJQ79019.1 hypothetical protein IGO_05440 [Bacillus toyonensis]